jgi:hypothetical protein
MNNIINMTKIIRIKKKNEYSLLNMKNVSGCGIGYKAIKGIKTDILSIIVFVNIKEDEKLLNMGDIIPKIMIYRQMYKP